MKFEPTRQSVSQHQVPDWYHDAKLGIFVHWGPYSVPGWAPPTGEQDQVTSEQGWDQWFFRNPYAEWYLNSLRIDGSPTQKYHAETYGPEYPYQNFADQFTQDSQAWDPDEWADLFQAAGARYVVLTSKHHDGYLLWPSKQPNPFKQGHHSQRDLVGELAEAVRARGMRFGIYYSGGLDWTFNPEPITTLLDLLITIPQSQDYCAYVNTHWRELFDRYQPDVMWNDIGYPAAADLPELFARYYNTVPNGVINDRFIQADLTSGLLGRLLRPLSIRRFASRAIQWAVTKRDSLPTGGHYDFRTPEYASFSRTTSTKWEATRGLGYSFGYNRAEGSEMMISNSELVNSFADIVSKNGNLLLNLGPMSDGTIPQLQRDRLLHLGRWLKTAGPAIYGTRPWARAAGTTADGRRVRFTTRDGQLFAIVLGDGQGDELSIDGLRLNTAATVRLLGHEGQLTWRQEADRLVVGLPQGHDQLAATVLQISEMESLA